MRELIRTTDNPKFIILDLGELYIQAGFSGEEQPRLIFPSVVGYHSPINEKELQHPIIGDEILYSESQESLNIVYPFLQDSWDWDGVLELLSFCFQKLGVSSNEHPLLYIEPSYGNSENTEKLVEILKNEFFVPEVYVVPSRELILKALYRKTGIVVELGYTISTCMAYYEGFAITPSHRNFKLCEELLLEKLNEFIKEKTGNKMKLYELIPLLEKKLYVAKNYENEQAYLERGFVESVKFDLPSETLEVGKKAFSIPELFFQPTIIELDEKSLSEIIYDSIMKGSMDTRTDIVDNIILAGRLSNLKGLDTRLRNELEKYFPNHFMKLPVKHDQCEVTAWIGANIFCQKGIPTSVSR
ncbi:MAG: hypothetical protein ACXAC7_06715 [Candidatus Hodarchaeales archaeon]|jgi:actin-related protein